MVNKSEYRWWISIQETSDRTIDDTMKEKIKEWHDPPLAIEVLEVLDKCIYGALSSDFVVMILQHEFDKALIRESVAYKDVVKLAVWRNGM